MKRKKIVIFLLTVAMISNMLFGIPLLASAAVTDSGTCGEDAYWQLEENVLTIYGTGNMDTYANNAPWMCYSNTITSIVVEEGFGALGTYAFAGCANAQTITIPNSTKSIGYFAFNGCKSLKEIRLPDYITYLGNCLFQNCESLTEILVPPYVSRIWTDTFTNCTSLKKIVFTGDAPTISAVMETDTKVDLESVTTVYYPRSNDSWTAEVLSMFDKAVAYTNLNDVYDKGYQMPEPTPIPTPTPPPIVINYPVTGTCGENITWKLTADGILTVSGTGAMYDYYYHSGDMPWYDYLEYIKKVVVEEGITYIGEFAFSGCRNLTEVSLPDSLIELGDLTFYYSYSLQEIELPQDLTIIGNSVFNSCYSLENLIIPDSVTYIGKAAFNGSGLKEITLSKNITSIEDSTFSCCYNLEKITIPQGVTTIGPLAFHSCDKLAEIRIPNSVTFISPDACNDAFAQCYNKSNIYYDGYFEELTSICNTNPTDIFNYCNIYCSKLEITVDQPVNGTVTVDKTDVKAGEAVTVTATPDADYKLDKIYVNGQEISDNTFVPTEDSTVTAIFKPAYYTVEFGYNLEHSDGTTEYVLIKTIKAESDKCIEEPANFAPNGYGVPSKQWYYICESESGYITGYNWNFDTQPIEHNTKFVIDVTSLVTVKFDLQGKGISMGDVKVAKRGALTALPTQSANGYCLTGWYFEPECINPVTIEIDRFYYDITTLYAKWEKLTATGVDLPVDPEKPLVDTSIIEDKASDEVVETVREQIVIENNRAIVSVETVEAVVDATEEDEAIVLPIAQTTTETVKEAVVDTQALKKVAQSDTDVVIELTEITLKLDASALSAITNQAEGESIGLKVEKVDESTLTERQQLVLVGKGETIILSAQIVSNSQKIGDFNGGTATIMLPFTPAKGRTAKDYSVYYVSEDGILEKMNAQYVDGHMVFTTNHFSDYIIAKEVIEELIRVKGKTRYETSFAIAKEIKAKMGVDKFDTIIIASGENFADALAGSYLAKVKGAPILMASGKDANIADIKAFVQSNLKSGGMYTFSVVQQQ